NEPKVKIALRPIGRGRQYSQADALGFAKAAPGQRRLPDAWFALDGHQPRLPRGHPGDDVCEPGQLRPPAHKNVPRRLPVPHAPTSLTPTASATWINRA